MSCRRLVAENVPVDGRRESKHSDKGFSVLNYSLIHLHVAITILRTVAVAVDGRYINAVGYAEEDPDMQLAFPLVWESRLWIGHCAENLAL